MTKKQTLKTKKISKCHTYIVEDFNDELKGLIKKDLVSICHGPYRAKYQKKYYNYKKTIREFLKICRKMDAKKKMGLVAELLAHVLIRKMYKKFSPISLFFNMEEKSMKKGFDVLFSEENKLWITEVKSGKRQKGNSITLHKQLLRSAKNDLSKRLTIADEDYRWRNALNGLEITRKTKSEKKKIELILNEKKDDSDSGKSDSTDCNVILVSTLYTKSQKNIIESLEELRESIDNEKLFNDLILFSVNKKTYSKVIAFFEEEAS